MIKIILIDDHKLILEGLNNILSSEKDISILSTFSSSAEALNFVKDNAIDVIITDLNMPNINGIELIKKIRKKSPDQKIIVLSMIDQQSIIIRMIKYKINGYLMKNEAQEELVSAIRKVAKGETFYNQDIRDRLFQNNIQLAKKTPRDIPRLSAREKEVLQLIIQEHTGKEIATKLFISEGTVITHRKHIIEKLGAKNTAGMVRIALELGLV